MTSKSVGWGREYQLVIIHGSDLKTNASYKGTRLRTQQPDSKLQYVLATHP